MSVARVAVVVFPGSNCDHDAHHAAGAVFGQDAHLVWHKDAELPAGTDLVVVPGGFSYGDYLRAGAIARFSPVMAAVQRHAAEGGLVLGVCNGFQVLCEAGLLPGALVRNAGLRFVCHDVHVRVESTATPFTAGLGTGDVLRLSVAHGEGNFTADAATLDALDAADPATGQVVFRYCDASGEVTDAANSNGSARGIAGIANGAGTVLGIMPHPERCVEAILGSPADGARLFRSVFESLGATVPAALATA